MKLKKTAIFETVIIFILNFIFIAGYAKFTLIPELTKSFHNNKKNLNSDLKEIIEKYKEKNDFITISDEFSKERNITILLESSDGNILYNNNPELWETEEISYVSSAFIIDDIYYNLKIYRKTNVYNVSALNGFIFYEILVIFLLVLLIFGTTNRKIITPIENLQKSIKNYKFGIMPKRTKGKTEIDIIQNNFVELVDELEKEKEKQNRIIASISHDIKTPLTAIMGYSDRLLTVNLNKDKKKDYIQKIHNKSLVLKELTEEFDDFLSCNIKETLKKGSISVKDFLDKLKEDYTEDLEEKNIKFIIKSKADDENLIIDIAKIRRVFSNIISNSIRYLDDKGKITIQAKIKGKFIEFTVSDNGTGVKEEDLEKIFEPLFTSDPSRKISGLGLSICKEIIETHGGEIFAKNNKENGLDVIFTLKRN